MNNPSQKRLLLAENNSDYRHSLLGLLELENYVVEQAASPDEASSKLQTMQFDLALVDMRLADDNDDADNSGLKIGKQATELGITTIVMTAYASFGAARKALRSLGAGSLAVDMFSKTDDPQALLDLISLALARPETASEAAAPRGLRIDLNKQLVWKNVTLIDLSKDQYALLACLCEKEGGVCTWQEMVLAIYDEDVSEKAAASDTRLKKLLERLKANLNGDEADAGFLVNAHGRGYRLETNP